MNIDLQNTTQKTYDRQFYGQETNGQIIIYKTPRILQKDKKIKGFIITKLAINRGCTRVFLTDKQYLIHVREPFVLFKYKPGYKSYIRKGPHYYYKRNISVIICDSDIP